MTRDISELLADAVEERARALADLRPTPAAFALTRVRIRRRRIVRHSVQAGAGLAACGVVAAGAWFGIHLDRAPAPPSQTPSTSVPPSPGPSGPTTSAPPTATGPTATPVVTPGLPSALPAPADLLATTGPGWLLTIYRSAPADSTGADGVVHAVVAVAPDGTRYRLADLPADQNVELLDWQPGEQRARVSYGPWGVDGGFTGWLDLRTGALTQDEPDVPTDRWFEARLADGSDLWSTNISSGPVELWAVPGGGQARLVGQLAGHWSKPRVSPSETRVATLADTADQVIVLDLATGARSTVELPVPDGDCALLGWLDDEALLVSCVDHSGPDPIVQRHPRLVRVEVGTGATTEVAQLGAGQPFALSGAVGVTVRPGTVAFPALTLDPQVPMADVCPDSVWEWSADGLRQVATPDGSDTFLLASSGGSLYVAGSAGCTDRVGPPQVQRVADDGSSTVLAPAPEPLVGTETRTSLSWLVAH